MSTKRHAGTTAAALTLAVGAISFAGSSCAAREETTPLGYVVAPSSVPRDAGESAAESADAAKALPP